MTILRHDPHRPGIDGATIVCPGCGQSYDTILDGRRMLPPRHYPQPTRNAYTRGRLVVGIDCAGGRNFQTLCCPVDDNELVRLVFIAQLEAARAKEAA